MDLEKLLPFQTKDFYNILNVMEGRPVTVRLLDPPLHEFINIGEKELNRLALDLKKTKASIVSRSRFFERI